MLEVNHSDDLWQFVQEFPQMVFLSVVREASPISELPCPFSSDLMSSRLLSERCVPGPIYSLIIGLREGLW